MNKQKPQQKPDGGDATQGTGQAETVLTTHAIWRAMREPGFTAAQLPGLWQQALEPDKQRQATNQQRLTTARAGAWLEGIEAMYRRCETYPQHAELTGVLDKMPPSAWHDDLRIGTQGSDLLWQATTAQLQQALDHDRQQHPKRRHTASNGILALAHIEQLTGPIIEQLNWNGGINSWATVAAGESSVRRRMRHVREHIQNQLLHSSDAAWTVFLGIVEHGYIIGETAELANTIAQNRPRSETKPGRDHANFP